jgi:hypothetical protein
MRFFILIWGNNPKLKKFAMIYKLYKNKKSKLQIYIFEILLELQKEKKYNLKIYFNFITN